jgi:hypothetical protein
MRTRVALAAIFVVASTLPGSSLRAQQTISCSRTTPTHEVCRINQPTVTQAVTQYKQIPLRYGDRVRINAGGCVQTGGSGATWKLYLNPQGPGSDHLYFGLVSLPGFVQDPDSSDDLNGFQRISSVLGRPIEIHDPPCPPRADCAVKNKGDVVGTLRLGYKDDDYHDNGYGGRDNGTGDQCRDVGPAWVTVNIDRYTNASQAVVVPPPLTGNWRVIIVSAVSGRTYTASMQLTMTGNNLTGTIQGPEIDASPVTGQYDVTSSTLRLVRDTGLETLQKYVLRSNEGKFSGTFSNQGRYADNGTIEMTLERH